MKRNIILTAFFIMLFCMNLSVFAAEEITSVEITEIPVVEPGASIADTKAAFEAPEGVTAESKWYIWDTEEETYVVVEDGVFTETDTYYLSVSAEAEEGYVFAEDFNFTYPEGADEDRISVWGEETPEGNMTWYFDMTPISFSTHVLQVEISTPEVAVGTTASIDEIIFRSNDALVDTENFEIEADWLCVTDDQIVTGQPFEANKVYQLNANIVAKEGYSFISDVLVLHNGTEEMVFSYPHKVEFFKEFSLMPPVERVELSGLSDVKAGEFPIQTLEIINDIESCEIFVLWFDEDGNEIYEEALEDGKTYTVQVEINLYGYEPISENLVYVIDGTEYQPTTVSTETNQAWLEMDYTVGETAPSNTGNIATLLIAGVAAVVIVAATITGIVVVIKNRKR